MQEKLLIYIHGEESQTPSWVVSDGTHASRQTMRGDPLELKKFALNRHVIVLVPGEDVVMLRAELPKMSHFRMLQALPFALEEQLIDEVDTLHFTPLKMPEASSFAIAIAAHERMQHWLALLKSWEIEPDILTPNFFALPFNDHCSIKLYNQIAIIRFNPYFGLACDRQNLPLILTQQLPNINKVAIENYTASSLFDNTNLPLIISETTKQSSDFLIDLLNGTPDLSPYNLLHGDYAGKKTSSSTKQKVQRLAIALTVGWGFLLFIYPFVSHWMLANEAAQLNKKIAQVYYRQFPKAKSIVAPYERFTQKLRQANGADTHNGLLMLIGKIGDSIKQADGIKLNRLAFQNDQLNIDLTALSSENLSSFTKALSAHQVSFKQQNASIEGTKVNATIIIE